MGDELPDDIRRMIELHDLVEARRLAGSIEREAWIAASRQIFEPGPRGSCCVCGKFQSIAQAHHVVPLAAQYDRGFRLPNCERVWLCPNHHAMLHIIIPDDNLSMTDSAFRARNRRAGTVLEDLSEDEFKTIMELVRRSMVEPE
mgnify:CR=1 FL=1